MDFASVLAAASIPLPVDHDDASTVSTSDKALASLIGSTFNVAMERDVLALDSIGLSVKGVDRAALKLSNPKAYEKVK